MCFVQKDKKGDIVESETLYWFDLCKLILSFLIIDQSKIFRFIILSSLYFCEISD